MNKSIFILAVLVFCGIGPNYGSGAESQKPYEAAVAENNSFAFDLFRSLQEEDAEENVFFSPYSIYTALSMLYNGATGRGKEEMAAALGYGDMELSDLNGRQLELKSMLERAGEKVKINVGNSLWANEGVTPRKSFNDALKRFYDSELYVRDFGDKKTVAEVNGWISDKTEGMIPEMLKGISPECVMFLINAIYFKGIWTHEFDPEATAGHVFVDHKGKETEVKMMHQTRRLPYWETREYQALKLSYGDGEASMYIILPRPGWNINDFLKGFDITEWNHLTGVMRSEETELGLPRFKMSYGVKRLNGALESLGMSHMFSPGYLMNITGDPRLYVEYVDHKAVMEVDERGTEAAAATIISVGKAAYTKPRWFMADRPFFFIIRDERSGLILFMGKLLYM